MAITFTERVEYSNTANNTTHTTGSYTPTAGRALIAIAFGTGTAVQPTAAGNGLTWNVEAHGSNGFSGTITVFSALTGTSPSAGGLAVSWTGDATTGGNIYVTEIAGCDLVDPVVQAVVRSSNVAAAGTPDVTFGAATLATSAVIVAMNNQSNPAGLTAPSGYSEVYDSAFITPTSGIEVATHTGPGSVTTVTWGSTTATAGRTCAAEIRLATSLPTKPRTFQTSMLTR